MIDNIFIEVKYNHAPFGDEVTVDKKSSKQKAVYQKPVYVQGEFPGCPLKVQSIGNGKFIRVQGSFSLFLQGHNSFGSNRLFSLCHKAITVAFTELNIPIRRSLKAAIRKAKLFEIDCSGSIKLSSNRQVGAAILQIGRSCLSAKNTIRVFRNETIYVNEKKRRRRIMFYDKQKQWEAKREKYPALNRLPHIDKVDRYVENVIRVEARFGSVKLKEIGLARVSDWKVETVRRLMVESLTELKLRGNITTSNERDIIEKLADADQIRFYAVQARPEIIEKMPKRTAARLRHNCRNIGLNVDLPFKDSPQVAELAQLLDAEKLRMSFPRWARRANAVAGYAASRRGN